MSMVLTEEEVLLQESTRKLVLDRGPISELRWLRDKGGTSDFSTALWSEMVEMGLSGVLIPEEFGGAGFGFRGAGIVIEELGRNLAATPFLSTSIMAVSAILAGGSQSQKEEFLPQIAAGEALFSLAFNEGPHYAPANLKTTAEQSVDEFTINGQKQFVIDGGFADWFIVSARTAPDKVSLFLVPRDAPGLSITPLKMVDSRNAATVVFDNVLVRADASLGGIDNGETVLKAILDRAVIAQSAEMLGSMQAAFEMTLEYLKERKQFGRVIGSFQALQHRAAEMFCEIELSRSVVRKALSSIDKEDDQSSHLASLSKATVNETFHKVASEGVQMHGGVGMTDEYDIGLYLKRARVVEKAFGSTSFHKSNYASLSGY